MKNWLIKKLGGFTTQEVDAAERSASDLTDQIEKGIAWLQGLIEKKDLEIKRLSDLIFTRAGFIISDQPEKESPKSINKRPSWRAIQRNLEDNDAKLAAEQLREMPIGTGDTEVPAKPKPRPS